MKTNHIVAGAVLAVVMVVIGGTAIWIHNNSYSSTPDKPQYSANITTFSVNISYLPGTNNSSLTIYLVSPDKHNFTADSVNPPTLLVSIGVKDVSNSSFNITSINIFPDFFKLVNGTINPQFPFEIKARNEVSLTLELDFSGASNYTGPLSIQLDATI